MIDVTSATNAVTEAGHAAGRLLARIEKEERLDPLAQKLTGLIRKLVPPGSLRDLLHGVPFGHPAHPALVQVPLGAWMSAAVLDALPFGSAPATTLIGVGTAAAIPAALSGAADFSTLHPEQQRVALVHWASVATAGSLYGLSLVARLSGNRAAGRKLALAGLAAASIGGFIGGHLAYRQAAGANHAESVPHVMPEGWHDVAALAELPERELSRRAVGTVPVLLYRDGERVLALADACSHLSGPLHEGELDDDPELGACVTCPWHGSVFALRDGAVVHGPATAPQPRLRTRVSDGRVEVALG